MWKTTLPLDIHEQRQRFPVVDMMSNPKQPEPAVQPLSLVERAIKESLHSPTFLDVKFYAFSRRSFADDGTMRIDKPQHVLAISSVLKKVDYFDKLLCNGFSESSGKVPVDAPFPYDRPSYTDEYDYESDSDLEDEQPSDLEADELKHQDGQIAGPSTPRTRNVVSGAQCQQIVVKDVAYHTWRAFIFYLYFEKVNFLSLKSTDDTQRVAELERALGDPEVVPPSSPKSMYRLAEKYGITDLQNLAFSAIRDRLSAKNIVQEVFSRFTSRYEKVRELEIGFLRSHYTEVGDALSTITERLVQGEFPYAGEVLKTLLDSRMENNGSQTPKGHSGTSSTRGFRPFHGVRALPIRGNVAPPSFRPQITAGGRVIHPPSPGWTPYQASTGFGDGDDDDF